MGKIEIIDADRPCDCHESTCDECHKRITSAYPFVLGGGHAANPGDSIYKIDMYRVKGDPDGYQIGGSHYKDMKIQPVEFIVANKIEFLPGNAIKYICRHKQKGGEQDIRKAIHYLKLMLKHDYNIVEE